MNNLGRLMRQCIKESGLKQNKVAEGLGLSPSRLSNYLSGSREPGLDVLSRFATFFGKSLDYFNLTQKDIVTDNEQYCTYLIAINEPINMTITTDLGIKHFKVNSRIAADIISSLNRSHDINNRSWR